MEFQFPGFRSVANAENVLAPLLPCRFGFSPAPNKEKSSFIDYLETAGLKEDGCSESANALCAVRVLPVPQFLGVSLTPIRCPKVGDLVATVRTGA